MAKDKTVGETFQSHDHEELTKDLVVRPDGEPDNMGGETFYCDDYEQVTGRERDGTVRDGGDKTVVAAKVVTPATPKHEAVSTDKAETK
jgi:hypothetical protein